MQTGTGLVYRQPLIRFSRSLRRWLVSCAATSKTTPHSSLLTQHFMMSGSLPSRFGTCCAAPARLGRSLDSIAPVTGPVPPWRRWRDRRLVARGFLPLRFTRKDVYAHQVVPDVLSVLERWGVSKSDTKAATSTECV